jgi:hypothetical protein
VRAARVLIAAVVCLAPATAHAGRTQYGWLFGTEVMPERGAELHTWVTEENGTKGIDYHDTLWGMQALIGVTDQLEVLFPVEFIWREAEGVPPGFTWKRWGVEARYRLVSGDPVDAPPFAPLVRLAVKRDISVRDTTIVEANFVASTTTPSGSVMGLVDLGVVAGINKDDQVFEARPGIGVSFKVVGDLRLGAEVFGRLDLENKAPRWIAAGPNLAWSHGRSWVSAAMGIGLYQIKTAPALQWGIMF